MTFHGGPPGGSQPLGRAGHRTWHMTPAEVWEDRRYGRHYRPEAYDADGFVHCTDDPRELIAVGNRYYTDDPRAYVALSIDCDRVRAPIVYEDDGRLFPHIYGPVETDAIVDIRPMTRHPSGRFLEIGEPSHEDPRPIDERPRPTPRQT